MHRTSYAPRGYVLMVVVVLGVVLASLAAILLYATGRDRAEGKQQQSSIRSVYCSEAAVAVGIEHLRELLEVNSSPSAADLNDVEARTIATLGSAMASATFPVLSVKYFDPVLNSVSDTPLTPTDQLQTITSGVNKGLFAQQTPIQVLATCKVDNASSSVADAIRVDLIPIFQFAVFFDGDLETYQPPAMSFNGRVHTNGRLWLSNGAANVDFLNTVTAGRRIVSRSAFAVSVAQANNRTRAFNNANNPALVGLPTSLSEGNTDAVQKAAINGVFGDFLLGGKVGDSSNGAQPLALPIRVSSSASCATDGGCGAGKACMKVRATDALGVCTDKIVSRPSECSTAGSIAEFGQSLAIELIRRPAAAYENTGLDAPYNDGVSTFTDVYTADFGPRPRITNAVAGTRESNDLFEVEVARSVPHVRASASLDDQGAALDRLYWKADIRIIDGVWYRKGSNEPVFDPELVNYTATTPSATDLNHLFGRVLRYAWWWDARENRVYCTTGDKNCVADGNRFQRGQQIRSADFDAHAFMVLLEDSNARNVLFPGGIIPPGGITLYMSETYDPVYEDANTKLPRAANVRNFLNFPYMHNHLVAGDIATPAAGQPARIAPVKTATGPTPTNAPTPYQIGFYPENLWGQHAPVSFRSLTPPFFDAAGTAPGTPAQLLQAYHTPNTTPMPNNIGCQPTSILTSPRIPGSRPASFTAATIKAPCIQAGATPLGAENAVRLVRAQSLPTQGFTFVTDNRLFVHGDVNVVGSGDATTRQGIPGKYALIADSITLQSEKFDERTRQGGRFHGFFKAPTDGTLNTFSTSSVTPWLAATNAADGDAPNMCSVGNTTALPMKVNASLMAGNVPSCVDGGNANGNRSGGINHFPRLVENWTNVAHVITGSIVSPYLAERGNSRFIEQGFSATAFATGRSSSAYNSQPGCTHTEPLRTWKLDPELLTGLDNLPPSTPRVVATDRLRWVRR